MNGASAEPCANTSSPPTSTSSTTIGRSQNFFRSLMNAHSSPIKPIFAPDPLKLPLHPPTRRLRVQWLSVDPEGRRRSRRTQPVLRQCTSHKARWRQHDVIDDPH